MQEKKIDPSKFLHLNVKNQLESSLKELTNVMESFSVDYSNAIQIVKLSALVIPSTLDNVLQSVKLSSTMTLITSILKQGITSISLEAFIQDYNMSNRVLEELNNLKIYNLNQCIMKESQFKSITFKNLNFVEKIFMKNLLVNMIWKKDFVVSSKITKSLLSEYETFLEIFEVETRRVTSLHQKKNLLNLSSDMV